MKVVDVMHTKVDYASFSDTVEDVSRIIFGRGINGVPVVKNDKVVGFITERDILAKFYPTMEEYMEDPIHAGNFENMEKRVDEILNYTVDKIMSHHPTTVTSDTPLLRAYSLMTIHKVGRLPVVDKKNHLIGILSKGDIFKAIVEERVSFVEEEGFYDWMAKDYDMIIDWKNRLEKEIPDLVDLFKKYKVSKVLDIASSTGEHSVALVKEGFDVVGVDTSSLMKQAADEKKSQLTQAVQKKLSFLSGPYQEVLPTMSTDFDATIFMGNALPHVLCTDRDILENTAQQLRKKNALLVFQMVNFEKLFKTQKGLREFSVRLVGKPREKQVGFVAFYSKTGKNTADDVWITFFNDGKRWLFRRMNNTIITYLSQKELVKKLKKLGFSKISFYGGEKGFYYDYLFRKPFKPLQSDVLVVVAKR